MNRQEVFDRINHVIKNGRNRESEELLDVLFYKKGTATKVVVIEYKKGGLFSDNIYVWSDTSPSQAIASAISRHANPDEMTVDDSSYVGSGNTQIETL